MPRALERRLVRPQTSPMMAAVRPVAQLTSDVRSHVSGLSVPASSGAHVALREAGRHAARRRPRLCHVTTVHSTAQSARDIPTTRFFAPRDTVKLYSVYDLRVHTVCASRRTLRPTSNDQADQRRSRSADDWYRVVRTAVSKLITKPRPLALLSKARVVAGSWARCVKIGWDIIALQKVDSRTSAPSTRLRHGSRARRPRAHSQR